MKINSFFFFFDPQTYVIFYSNRKIGKFEFTNICYSLFKKKHRKIWKFTMSIFKFLLGYSYFILICFLYKNHYTTIYERET